MTNIIQEIKNRLEENNFKEDDILWIGSEDGQYAMGWNDFQEKFEDIEYDQGYGAQEIASDLVMVMSNGTYFSRSEYDGSEGWDYHKIPVKTDNPKSFAYICVNQVAEIGWKDLETMNKTEKGNCSVCGQLMIVNDYSKGYCHSCRRELEYENYRKTGKFEFNPPTSSAT